MEAREATASQLLDRFAAIHSSRDHVCAYCDWIWTTRGLSGSVSRDGSDREQVHEIAEKVREVVRQDKATLDANLEWNEPSKGYTPFRRSGPSSGPRPEHARDIASSADFAERCILSHISRRHGDRRGGSARSPEERLSLDQLPDLSLFTSTGRAVPLDK